MESSQPSADGEPALGHGAVRAHRAARHRQLEEFRCRALTNIACSTCCHRVPRRVLRLWIRALGWGRSSAGHRIWPQGSSGRCARPCRRGTAAGRAAGDGAPRPPTITEASSDRRSSPTLGHDRAARPMWLVSVRRRRPRP
jgi:hypothetical protein